MKETPSKMSSPTLSPFTFITWKEDEHAVVAGTSDTKLGYFQLLTIDGIDIDDIVAYAVEQKGEHALSDSLATHFPAYVAAVAAQKGSQCFVTTGKAEVEYADMNTGEVAEATFDATEANFEEAVRVDTARAVHGKNPAEGGAAAAAEEDNDDDYEDIDEEDEDGQHPAHAEEDAYMARRRLLDMISTQLQTAMSIAFDLGFSVEETQEAYKRAIPPQLHVPHSLEECLQVAQGNPALQEFLSGLATSHAGMPGADSHGDGEEGQEGGVGAGEMPQGVPQGANCPQQ